MPFRWHLQYIELQITVNSHSQGCDFALLLFTHLGMFHYSSVSRSLFCTTLTSWNILKDWVSKDQEFLSNSVRAQWMEHRHCPASWTLQMNVWMVTNGSKERAMSACAMLNVCFVLFFFNHGAQCLWPLLTWRVNMLKKRLFISTSNVTAFEVLVLCLECLHQEIINVRQYRKTRSTKSQCINQRSNREAKGNSHRDATITMLQFGNWVWGMWCDTCHYMHYFDIFVEIFTI